MKRQRALYLPTVILHPKGRELEDVSDRTNAQVPREAGEEAGVQQGRERLFRWRQAKCDKIIPLSRFSQNDDHLKFSDLEVLEHVPIPKNIKTEKYRIRPIKHTHT